MLETLYVTGDDSPFITEQDLIQKGVLAARSMVTGANDITMCIDCGEPIGIERKKIVPSTRRCITCEVIDAQYSKLFSR